MEVVDYGMVELGNEAYTGMLRVSGPGHAITTLNVYPKRKFTTSPLFYSGVLETHVHEPYDDAVRTGAVTVEQYVRGETHDGRLLARLRLGMTVDYPNIKGVKMLNDYYFDPLQDWVCVMVRKRSQSKLDEEVYEETRLLSGPNAGGPDRFPRAIEVYSVDEKAKRRELTRSYSMTEVTERKVDDTEIRLTQFGLPEPEGVVWTKPIPLYVWLLVATGILAATSVAIRWLQVRSRRNSQAPPSAR